MGADRRPGTILYFWRGARRKDLRWWGPLWKKPKPDAPVTLREVIRFFFIGAAIMAVLWLGWIGFADFFSR
jgi:hypothetical protein